MLMVICFGVVGMWVFSFVIIGYSMHSASSVA